MSTFHTFRAPDTRSALAMVKAALGAEAVILSTREVGAGLFRAKEIEVTAALPEPPVQTRSLGAAAYAAQPVRATPSAARPLNGLKEPDLRADAAVAASARPFAPSPSAPRVAAAPPADAQLSDELVRLRGAMDDMRRELRRGHGEREHRRSSEAAALLAQLLEGGVEEAVAEACLRQAAELAPNGSTAALTAALREALAERVVAGRAPWLPDGGRRIIALVGPTGVGKTTTLAKIAARALMASQLKVALVTVDTYRIGASEQILRYGEIMGVPTTVARDRVELVRAIERTPRADLILIDTAGRSVSEAVARQAEMLRSVEGVQLYLTVSACTGAREMAAAAERYQGLHPERLVVTKIDEAAGPGSLVSASVRIGRPIVAVTDGQRVPEDIHALSSGDLVDLVSGAGRRMLREPDAQVGGE